MSWDVFFTIIMYKFYLMCTLAEQQYNFLYKTKYSRGSLNGVTC